MKYLHIFLRKKFRKLNIGGQASMTKIIESKRQWVSVPKFIEHYDLSTATAYKLIHAKGFSKSKGKQELIGLI